MEEYTRNMTDRSDFIEGIDNDALDFSHLEQFIHDNSAPISNSDTNCRSDEQQEQQQEQQFQQQSYEQQQQHHIQTTNSTYTNLNDNSNNIQNDNDNNNNVDNSCNKINNIKISSQNKNINNTYDNNDINSNNHNSDSNSKCNININNKYKNFSKNINNRNNENLINNNNNYNNNNTDNNKYYYINNSKDKNIDNKNIKNDDIITTVTTPTTITTLTTPPSRLLVNLPDSINHAKNFNCKTNNNNKINNKIDKQIIITQTTTTPAIPTPTTTTTSTTPSIISLISNHSHLPESPPDSGSEPPFSPTDINSITTITTTSLSSGNMITTGNNIKFPITTTTVHGSSNTTCQQQQQQQQQSNPSEHVTHHRNHVKNHLKHNLNVSMNFNQPPTPGQEIGDLTNISSGSGEITNQIINISNSNLTTSSVSLSSPALSKPTSNIHMSHNNVDQHQQQQHQQQNSAQNANSYNDQMDNSFYNLRTNNNDSNETSILGEAVLINKSDNELLANEFELLHQQQQQQHQMIDLERNYRNDVLNRSNNNSNNSNNNNILNGNIHSMQSTSNNNLQHNHANNNNNIISENNIINNVCHSNIMELVGVTMQATSEDINRLKSDIYSSQLTQQEQQPQCQQTSSHTLTEITNETNINILDAAVAASFQNITQVTNQSLSLLSQQNSAITSNNQSISNQLSPPLMIYTSNGGRKRKLSQLNQSVYGLQLPTSQQLQQEQPNHHQQQQKQEENPIKSQQHQHLHQQNNVQQSEIVQQLTHNISLIKPEPNLNDTLTSPIIQMNSDFHHHHHHHLPNDFHYNIHQSQSSPISPTSVNSQILNLNSINTKLSLESSDSNGLDSQILQQQQQQQEPNQSQQQQQNNNNADNLSDTCPLQCIRFSPFQQQNWHTLVDQNLQELPIPHFRVDADKGFNFSNSDDAFVCQKKNHFQITCHAQLQGNPVFIKVSNGLEKIKSFHIHFYGVKVESINQIIRIEQSQSDRSKKPFHPVPVDLLNNHLVSKITVGRLHFSETTSNNMRKKGRPNPEQRYFQLIVSLNSHTHSGQYPVIVQGSEYIIVRASNPGQFESDVELCWQRGLTNDSICHNGRVGINTDRPDESLVIHGNLKVSGHIVQPSDSRAKREISELDTAEQLKNLQKIRVVKYRYEPEFAIHSGLKKPSSSSGHHNNYNNCNNLYGNINDNNINNNDNKKYKKNNKVHNNNQLNDFISNCDTDDDNDDDYSDDDDNSEIIDTGVIAQEVREVLPDAVKEAGSIVLPNGQVIENFLLVNKDRILMENIGAVKELCKVTGSLETRIEQLEKINSKILHIQQMDRNQQNNNSSSKNSYKYLLNDYYNKKTLSSTPPDEICSNSIIQVIIIILVIIMAVCLTAISTLYFVERAKRNYSDHYLYNHELIPSKNRIEDRHFKYFENVNVNDNRGDHGGGHGDGGSIDVNIGVITTQIPFDQQYHHHQIQQKYQTHQQQYLDSRKINSETYTSPVIIDDNGDSGINVVTSTSSIMNYNSKNDNSNHDLSQQLYDISPATTTGSFNKNFTTTKFPFIHHQQHHQHHHHHQEYYAITLINNSAVTMPTQQSTTTQLTPILTLTSNNNNNNEKENAQEQQKYFNLNGKIIGNRKMLSNHHDNQKIKFDNNSNNNISKNIANNSNNENNNNDVEYIGGGGSASIIGSVGDGEDANFATVSEIINKGGGTVTGDIDGTIIIGSSIGNDENNNNNNNISSSSSSIEIAAVPQDVENNSIDSDLIQKQLQKTTLNVKPIKIYNKENIKIDSNKIIGNITEQIENNENLNDNNNDDN